MKKAQALQENEGNGLEHLREAMAGGRGVILATAHFSFFFEYGAVALGKAGIPLTIGTLPEPTAALTEWRAKWRQRWNTETVPVGADPFSSIQIVRSLEAGRCVALLADRPIAEHGLPVDLPNGRMLFSTAPALLASMTKCPVVPVIVVRLRGGQYRLNRQAAHPGRGDITGTEKTGDRGLHPADRRRIVRGNHPTPHAVVSICPRLRMKRLLLFALTFPLALMAAQPMSEDETLQLLEQIAAKRADGAVQSDFREEKKLAMMEKPVVENGTIAFLAPNKFRREVPGKSLTVCDGETLWMYYPAYKEAEKYTLSSNKRSGNRSPP